MNWPPPPPETNRRTRPKRKCRPADRRTAPLSAASIRVKGGVPITDPFTTSGDSLLNQIGGGNRWTAGPAVELCLPFRLRDRELLDVPGPAEWRIPPGPIQPFAGAGPVFDYVSGVNVHPGTLGFHVGGGSVTRGGGTIAGGVEVHAGRVLLSPELRYSRYSAESLGANLGNLFTFNQNQATFLPGISFGGRR